MYYQCCDTRWTAVVGGLPIVYDGEGTKAAASMAAIAKTAT